jgi:hypothetical protein
MCDTPTYALTVSYEVAGGAYPWRVCGLRLNREEAEQHLTYCHDLPPLAAGARVALARVDAAHAAALPRVEWTRPEGRTELRRVDGMEMTRQAAERLLIGEYRRTPAEARELTSA